LPSASVPASVPEVSPPPAVLPLSSPAPQPSSSQLPFPMITRTRDNTRKAKEFPDFIAHHTSTASDPISFSQANKCTQWRDAMAAEITALADNNTWTLVPPPTDQKIIGCKWVYKTKRNADGTINHFKARLVAKGYNQEHGVDYEETYSPVIRSTTIRVILSLAISSNWSIQQLDVSNAFLNGNLSETVFMEQPQGFLDTTYPNYVCLLNKSLYGLKQAPRAWFEKLSITLLQMGFHSSSYDPSLFISHSNNQILLVLIYVDDILITGNNIISIQHCITHLKGKFTIRDLGTVHYFLGIEANFNEKGLCLTQTKYLIDLLKRTNMATTKLVFSPMASGTTLSKEDSSFFDNPTLYRSVVGALQYATLTRPDISFSVNKLSQFMHQPTEMHWSAVKRILRYLAGSLDTGLQFYRKSTIQIHAYSDADWAGSIDDRRSTSGYCIFLGSNLVSWCAKKQPTVSRSSTEAEYRSLALTCTELMWLQQLLTELGLHSQPTPILWCDNIGATFLASNPMFHARMKHIEIDYHFVRERVAAKQLQVKFLCSADQLADIMTKPLPLSRFQLLRNKLNVSSMTLA
jgi:Reverse transcriptase (RNA-dependent DNA polymerase)